MSENPDIIFDLLRDKDPGTRVVAFEAFRQIAATDQSRVGSILADVVNVLKIEVLPNLTNETDPECREALTRIAYGIGTLAGKIDNPSTILPLLGPLIELLNHPYPRVRAAIISGIGSFFRALPDELDDPIINILLRPFRDLESEVRAAAAFAWGSIAHSSPEKAASAISPVFALLSDTNETVRAEAAGFFQSLGKKLQGECTMALPILREMRDNDPNEIVRERASAAVQAIIADRG
mgnify:CR=1 FL=1